MNSQGSTVLARDVLSRVWRLGDIPERTLTGVSRSNWRVGSRHWLSCCSADRLEQFEDETRLLASLDGVAGELLEAPQIVPSADGENSHRSDGLCWRLTTHLSGSHPKANDRGAYDELARALAQVHARLSEVERSGFIPRRGLVDALPRLLSELQEPDWHAATTDAREAEVVQSLGNWLRGHWSLVEVLPMQLIHGDWNPQNVLCTPASPAAITGVLDFEFAALDLVEIDIAQIFSTLLMWSDLEQAASMTAMKRVLDVYDGARQRRTCIRTVFVCMGAYWLHNYFYWRALNGSTGRFGEVLMRQPGRIATVFSFVSHAAF